MGRDADFTATVAKALAERAGFVCSYAGCDATTIGPSGESPTSSNKTGMACHIYAAADGPAARRVMPEKSIDELRSIENGIWMCYKHGKLIDGDECTFTPELLSNWRRIAERQAELRHSLGRNLTSIDMIAEPLAPYFIEIDAPAFVGEIAEAFRLSYIEDIWGKQTALSARDFVIEIARNAFVHGSALEFSFAAGQHAITITDDGREFSIAELENTKSLKGGLTSLNELRKSSPNIIVSYSRTANKNVTVLTTSSNIGEFVKTSQCAVRFNHGIDLLESAMKSIIDRPQCETIFLYTKYGVISYSDLGVLKVGLEIHNLTDRDIVLVISTHSDGIRRYIAENLKNVRLIERIDEPNR